MSVPGYAHGIQTSFLATMNSRAQAARIAKAADPIQAVSITPGAKATQTAAAQDSGSGSFFDQVLDIINPLQHLPVVGTLYRAVTGDKIGDVAQVAGDTLYGGLMGLGSSLANLIFKDATGKDFGDTVLAAVESIGSDTPTAVADAKVKAAQGKAAQAAPTVVAALTPEVRKPQTTPAATTPVQTPATPASVVPAQATMLADPGSFMAALKAKGIDPALGLRAMQAYQKSLGLAQP